MNNDDELQDELLPIPETGERYGYLLTDLVLCALPMRDPGAGVQKWVRENGLTRLRLDAGSYLNESGEHVDQIPYGKVPRAILLGVCSEAKRTDDPVVELGASMRDYLRRLGFGIGGHQARSVMRNLELVASMRLEITRFHDDTRARRDFFQIAENIDNVMFGKVEPDGQDGLFRSSITLTPQMMEQIRAHAMPVDMEAWAWLNKASKSALPIDIYTWLSYRLPHVSGRGVTIPWEGIFNQFGGADNKLRQARETFGKALELVLKVYPAAVGKVELTREGVQLRRAASPITRRKPKGLAS